MAERRVSDRISQRDPAPRDPALSDRLAGRGHPLVLDGATGTELERAGLSTGLPLWSTHALLEAPAAIAEIHVRYLEAGAELITANTFRTQRRILARAGLGREDRSLTQRAVDLARGAIEDHAQDHVGSASTKPGPPWVAGSLPPLEDCYQPERVAPPEDLDREHGRQAELLAEAGVDLILVETMNSRVEALHASRAAAGGAPDPCTGATSRRRGERMASPRERSGVLATPWHVVCSTGSR